MNETLILKLKEKINQLQEKIKAYQVVINDLEAPEIIFKIDEDKNPSTIRDRILFASQQFNGEFSRMDLMEKTNIDGFGSIIPITSFAPEFSRLVKAKQLICITKHHGRHAGKYKRR